MNKQKFIELLREPSSISKDELSGLENVTRQYPYFQSAHLLLAKGSRLRKDPNTKKRISRAAVYCTDRTLLKKYISGDMIFLDSVKRPPINVDEELPEKKARKLDRPAVNKFANNKSETSQTSTSNTVTPESQDSDFNPESILDEIKDGLASYKESKKHFEEYFREEEEDKAVNEALSKANLKAVEEESEVDEYTEISREIDSENHDADNLETDITSPSENQSISDEHESNSASLDDELEFDIIGIIEEIKNDEALERVNQQETEASNQQALSEVNNPETIEKDTSKVEKSDEFPTSNTDVDEPKKSSYSNKIVISGSNKPKSQKEERAENDSKQIVPNSKEITEPSEEKEEPSGDSSSSSGDVNAPMGMLVDRDDSKTNSDENLSPGELRKAKMKRLKMQKEIIDDFIDTTPEMPKAQRKPKPAEEKPEDLSASSQEAKIEIISENMAIIYKNQGKIEKAIDIYNKLILKFPEKEAYFATRIKELK